MEIKVYTKTGDKGTTSLVGGTRVQKDNIRLNAYGTVDELNSFVGVLNDQLEDDQIREWLLVIQDRLFIIGSTLATESNRKIRIPLPTLEESEITGLEEKIDFMQESLPPLRNFILPGGHLAGSAAHVCRSVCRRAERACIHLRNNDEEVSDMVIKYINRLSDFFFVLSRFIVHNHGGKEIAWRPNG